MTQVLVKKDEEAQEEEEIEEEAKEVDEEKEEEKEKPLPPFIDAMAKMLDTGIYDPNELNLRRKHPKLGRKIAELNHRVGEIEHTIENLKKYLEPELKKNFKKELDYWFERDWKNMLRSL